jgi:hypothetical protein
MEIMFYFLLPYFCLTLLRYQCSLSDRMNDCPPYERFTSFYR